MEDWYVRVFQLVIIPIIIGIVEVVKRAGLPVNFTARIRYIRYIWNPLCTTLLDGIIIGLMVGLSATGLYSGSKNVFTTSGKQSGKK